MSTSYTYATLTAEIIDWVEDDGTEFAAAVDDIIKLAEDRVLRDLNLTLFDADTTSALNASTAVLNKPASLLVTRELYTVDGSGNWTFIEPKQWSYLKDYHPYTNSDTASAVAKYWCDYDEDQYFFAPQSDTAQTIAIRYMARPNSLVTDTTGTWLSTNVGDLLFNACLVGSEGYLKGDERIPVWKQEYAERLQLAQAELKQYKFRDYQPMAAIPIKEAG